MLYFLIFILGGIAYSNPLFYPAFFVASIVFYMRKYVQLRQKNVDSTNCILILMGYALPFSWRSLVGSHYSSLPISWFYILGMLYTASVLLRSNKIIIRKNGSLLLFSMLSLIIAALPLLYIPIGFNKQALTQFIVLSFNNVLIFTSVFQSGTLNSNGMALVKRAYVTGAVMTSCMLIIQFVVHKGLGVQFGYIDYLRNRELLYFLFADISHGTLYLATAAFWIIYDGQNGGHIVFNYALVFIIIFGSALTSARTGLFILFLFVFMFTLIAQQGFIKRLFTILMLGFGGYYSLQVIQSVRNFDTVGDFTNGSGRFEGYASAFQLLKMKPLLGYGYSQDYLALILGQPIPHLSFLQYALHGGIFFALVLFSTQFLILRATLKKKSVCSWLLAIVLVGTCLVPDLFATRFATLLCIIAISSQVKNSADNTLFINAV